MSKPIKILVVTLFFAMLIIGGTVIWRIANEKNIPAPSTNNTTTSSDATSTELGSDAIDTSDWSLYRNDDLNIEMRIPSSFGSPKEFIGPDPGNEKEFWRTMNGQAMWSHNGLQVTIMSKQSTSTIEEFNNGLGRDFGADPQPLNINDMQMLVAGDTRDTIRTNKKTTASKKFLLKKDDTYYLIQVTASASSTEQAVQNLSTFDAIVDTVKAVK